MFQSLVITLREGLEAALIVGIVLAYLRKTGRSRWNATVYWALAIAIAASIAAGYLVHRLEVGEDAYEGWLMLAGAVVVASMVFWMWRTGKHMKRDIENRLSTLSAPTRAASLGLFSFVFLMVFREGIETVLFLAAVALRTTELLNFMGGVIGLALAIGLGVSFFKGSVKVDLRKFFSITTLVLFVIAFQLLVTGVHELSEARILPSSRTEMSLVGPIVNNDVFFFIVIVALCLFLVIAQRIQASGRADLSQLPAPERRRILAEQQRDRFWKISATAVALLIMVLISAQFIYSHVAHAGTPPEQVQLAHGAVRVPMSRLSDHNLHRFVVDVEGREVRVVAILDASDTVRAGLDACLICGHQGYYQDGTNVICRNCGAEIYVPSIGLAGGCNPVHIAYRVENGELVFSDDALRAAIKFFQ